MNPVVPPLVDLAPAVAAGAPAVPGVNLAVNLAIVLTIFFIGLYTILTSRNLVKTVIGIEILAKAVTLNLVWAGHFQNRVALGEALAVIAIAIDAVVVAILMSLVVTAHRHYGTVDAEALTRLKG